VNLAWLVSKDLFPVPRGWHVHSVSRYDCAVVLTRLCPSKSEEEDGETSGFGRDADSESNSESDRHSDDRRKAHLQSRETTRGTVPWMMHQAKTRSDWWRG